MGVSLQITCIAAIWIDALGTLGTHDTEHVSQLASPVVTQIGTQSGPRHQYAELISPPDSHPHKHNPSIPVSD
jgi:hypothetical protein